MKNKYLYLSLIPLIIFFVMFLFVYLNDFNKNLNLSYFTMVFMVYSSFIYFVGTSDPIFKKYVPYFVVIMAFAFIYLDYNYVLLFGPLGSLVYLPISLIYYGILAFKDSEEYQNRNIIKKRRKNNKRQRG